MKLFYDSPLDISRPPPLGSSIDEKFWPNWESVKTSFWGSRCAPGGGGAKGAEKDHIFILIVAVLYSITEWPKEKD